MNTPEKCADCGEPYDTHRPLMAMLAHWEAGCPATTVEVVIGITKDGHVFSVPEFKPSRALPDLKALLRYMADKVVRE